MPNIDFEGIAQLQADDDPYGFLLLILIDHPSFVGGIRIVDDTSPLTIGTDVFVALPLRAQLPQDVAREATTARLAVDNVGQDLVGELEALPPGAALDITLRLVSRANPTSIKWEYTAGGSTAAVDYGSVVFTLGDDEVLRQNVVTLRYDPETIPGIFPD